MNILYHKSNFKPLPYKFVTRHLRSKKAFQDIMGEGLHA